MDRPLGDLGAIQLFAFLERPFALTVSGFEVQGALPFLEALFLGGSFHRSRVSSSFSITSRTQAVAGMSLSNATFLTF